MEEAGGGSQFTFELRGDHSATCRWSLPSCIRQSGPTSTRQRPLYSQYFPIASSGLDCRLVLYPRGDSLLLPGHMSLYIQLMDPTNSKSPFDRFVWYKLTAYHPAEASKSVVKDSWYRFSAKRKSHGWSDFAPVSGFVEGETLIVTADITLLHETISFSPQDGKFTWKLHNFSLFKDTLKTQRVTSPTFPVNTDSDSGLKLSMYQSVGTGAGGDHLSIILESKEDSTTKPVSSNAEPGCWVLFRVTVMNQVPGGSNFHKDSYGRFGVDGPSLGWNEFMKMDEFLGSGSDKSSYLVDGCVVFNVSYHVLKETSVVVNKGVLRGNCKGGDGGGYYGKFTWRIGGFSKLKEVLKKRKVTGICIKSKKFQVGGRDCRLIVYPRGQSQPPCHLSLFLEVTDPRAPSPDWTCFVSHRLSVLCQKFDGPMVSKESQNRYSKVAKDWGWREFLSLTSLFDQGTGYLVDDTVGFCAEVMVLKEAHELMDITPRGLMCFTWKVENFLAFKDIMETRKIFSKFFDVGGCELRIGAYESFDTICIYLESDQPSSSSGGDPEKNFWVRYRMGILNQNDASRSVWRESSICTKAWNNSVLQFMKVQEMMTPDSGFLVRDSVIFVCEILDCCPWFEFSDLEVFASENEKEETLTTEPDSSEEESTATDSDEEVRSTVIDTDELFRTLLLSAGFHLPSKTSPSSPEPSTFLRENVLDTGAFSGFLTGLRVSLSHPDKVKQILPPRTRCTGDNWACTGPLRSLQDYPAELTNLIKLVLRSSLKEAIVDLFLDTMVECCEEASTSGDADANSTVSFLETMVEGCEEASGSTFWGCSTESGGARVSETSSSPGSDERTESDKTFGVEGLASISLADTAEKVDFHKMKMPDQSAKLFSMILSLFKSLDSSVQGLQDNSPVRKRHPHAIVRKISTLLEKAPRQFIPDIVSIVPKLVDPADHTDAASLVLSQVAAPGYELPEQHEMFNALGQLTYGKEVAESVLNWVFHLIGDANDEESLITSIELLINHSSRCNQFHCAIQGIRMRLKLWGADVPQCVLDLMCKTIQNFPDAAQTLLKANDADQLPYSDKTVDGSGPYLYKQGRFSDAYLLFEMLQIPSLFMEVCLVVEKSVASGSLGIEDFASALERRYKYQSTQLKSQQQDLSAVMALGKELSVSTEGKVFDFLRMLYVKFFRIYDDQEHRLRMLDTLVERAMDTLCRVDISNPGSWSGTMCNTDFDMSVLLVLAQENVLVLEIVMNLMRQVAHQVEAEQDNVLDHICAVEDDNARLKEERKAEAARFEQEKELLKKRAAESEAACSHLRSDLKEEKDQFAIEKKHLLKEKRDMESQLEWLKSEKDEKVTKLTAEKRSLQDRVHEMEAQLLQLKSRQKEELKAMTTEKNALAERLKKAEAVQRRLEEEVKRHATEAVKRKALVSEVRQLEESVSKAEAEKREKQKQVTQCETFIGSLKGKLEAAQQYIQTLETSLRDEMERHAPLYSVGLEMLTSKELETVAEIHELGLRQIREIQQQRQSEISLLANVPQVAPGLYSGQPQAPARKPSPIVPPKGAGSEENGHKTGGI
ncbi:MATH domain and coiled-coil domain-containing protein [Carex littledalei]|uniref:MATH domain and coiled-coil domain-containing protein n=1 Tax=Carex littledalei TaxID=544730 RepID=A0A833RMM4_9POAL|nr:MATH domain and coiled-coil domain-containing protein [Carex littledalei]